MKTILGSNHMFLYPDSITNAEVHTETLAKLSSNEKIDALDCWLWRGSRADAEREILKSSGKIINYNIGDRFGEAPSNPASPDRSERDYAYSTVMREIEYALSLDSKKIVIGSGRDFPCDRDSAKERFFEFMMKLGEELPHDVMLTLEPTDRDIDKYFLFGPLDETVDFVNRVKKAGFANFGLLLDMCHVPLMHETLESAIEKSRDVLEHIHLGNCVIKDKESAFYGDKHPAWNYPGSEYSSEDGVRFIKMLREIGYTDKDNNTISFEMRPMGELSSEESLIEFVKVFKRAMEE